MKRRRHKRSRHAGRDQERRPLTVFCCCFELSPDPDLEPESDDDADRADGTLQIIVEAFNVHEAAEKCRARLHQLAAANDALRAVVVYTNAFVELQRGDLARGVIVNHQTLGDIVSYRYLPKQGDIAAREHVFRDEREDIVEEDIAEDEDARQDDREDLDDPWDDEEAGAGDDGSTRPIFWARWKLYWCETEDHDEDWFIIARSAREATEYHEDMEGYDRGEAKAELVCVMPSSLQGDSQHGARYPSIETLRACGGEILPYVPNDGHDELRENLGSGGRVVRIKGRVYGEGDIVSNARGRLGVEPDA